MSLKLVKWHMTTLSLFRKICHSRYYNNSSVTMEQYNTQTPYCEYCSSLRVLIHPWFPQPSWNPDAFCALARRGQMVYRLWALELHRLRNESWQLLDFSCYCAFLSLGFFLCEVAITFCLKDYCKALCGIFFLNHIAQFLVFGMGSIINSLPICLLSLTCSWACSHCLLSAGISCHWSSTWLSVPCPLRHSSSIISCKPILILIVLYLGLVLVLHLNYVNIPLSQYWHYNTNNANISDSNITMVAYVYLQCVKHCASISQTWLQLVPQKWII